MTLLRQSSFYLAARGVPALINFAAIAVFSRLLVPEAYGKYTIVITGVAFAFATLFQWLGLGLLRYLPVYPEQRDAFLSTMAAGFLATAFLAACLGGLAYLSVADPELRGFIAIGTALLWAQAWFNLNLELVRIDLSPQRYGLLSILRAGIVLVLGAGLVYLGFGVHGLLVAVVFGTVVPMLWKSTLSQWKGVRLRAVDWSIFRRVLVYGAPLTASFALASVIAGADRFLLGWYLGADAAGRYAVPYDLAQQGLATAMIVVNLAAYPLIVRALEQEGDAAARHQIKRTMVALFLVALPIAAGLAVLSENIAEVVLGEAFRDTATSLIPWFALAALIAGTKAYYFDLSFHLRGKTMPQVWVGLVAATVNVLLNLWWIPILGVTGAAYATVVSYAVALVLIWIVGRRLYRLPPPDKEVAKTVAAAAVMAALLYFTLPFKGVTALILQVGLGAAVYGAVLFILDFLDIRSQAKNYL